MKNSAALQRSDRVAVELVAVAAVLCLLAGLSVWWVHERGYILYYGDAKAHLDLSRSILDSRTPGYDQLGTVWLPLLHLLILPLVGNDWLWSTGLAGSIPVATCFVIAAWCFYFSARAAYGSSIAAAVTLACFALNPNVLYLASIPMTELVFVAGLGMVLVAFVRFRATQSKIFLLMGVLASWAMSLTRYDGWFLIPFTALWFARLAGSKRRSIFVVFGLAASIVPLYWLGHCWWETGNALDFYNGAYSAKAIQGSHPYPGYHDWGTAVRYYVKAGQLCAGAPLLFLGLAGIACAAAKESFSVLGFLFLTPVFYIWSLYSSGNPIFVPQYWPHAYYNTRYGIAIVVLAAFAAGAIVIAVDLKWRRYTWVLPLVAILPWLFNPSPENWICWKESRVNSAGRRAWTQAAGEFFRLHYQPGQGILTRCCGDLTGILSTAGIPLKETLHEGNGPGWLANVSRPDLVHQETWAIVLAGDRVSEALQRVPSYRVVFDIPIKGAPDLQIYRRVE